MRTNIADIGRADYDLSPPDKIGRIPDDTRSCIVPSPGVLEPKVSACDDASTMTRQREWMGAKSQSYGA